jgi:hypothetical protein
MSAPEGADLCPTWPADWCLILGSTLSRAQPFLHCHGTHGLNEALLRYQCVGPTIPDSPNAVTSDDADQASVAVVSMMPVMATGLAKRRKSKLAA